MHDESSFKEFVAGANSSRILDTTRNSVFWTVPTEVPITSVISWQVCPSWCLRRNASLWRDGTVSRNRKRIVLSTMVQEGIESDPGQPCPERAGGPKLPIALYAPMNTSCAKSSAS
jgi:hypothetical protein